MLKTATHPHGHKAGLVGSLETVAKYGVASATAGYFLGAYPDRQRVKGVPTLPAVGGALKLVSLALTHFKVGGVASKVRPYLDVLGNSWIAVYVATLASSQGYKKSGQVRALVSANDVAALKKAVPGSTILGVSEKAPPGRVLNVSDIEAIANRTR